MANIRALCFLLILSMAPQPAAADSWAAPQVKEVFSASRDHFVRIIPGSNLAATQGFAGAAKGPPAVAEFYQRQADRSYHWMRTVELLNPLAPVDFFVSNGGQLATIDNWHNRG